MAVVQAESFKQSLIDRGGETGRLIASRDWSGTPLGAIEAWPQTLRTAVGIMVTTRHPVFIFWGPELACLYNDAYAASLGPEKHPSILGMPAPEAFPEAYPVVAADLAQVMAGGEATWAENNLVPITRNGRVEEVYWTYSYGPILDPDAPNGVGGVLTFITETTKAVVGRRESEERYRTLFESIDDGCCIIDVLFDDQERPIDYRFLETNPAFEQQTGLKDAEGKLARELAPGLEQHWFDIYGRVASTGEPTRFENGSEVMGRWFDVYAFQVGEPGERRVGLLFSDITERKRAETALREEEAHFRLMANAVPQIVWITDAEGRVEFFNRHWWEYTGAPDEPTTASEVSANHLHPDDAAATIAAFDEARQTGTTFLVEHRIRSEAGEYRWFLVRGEPYRDPVTGEIMRWYGASIDIHDRKLAEEQLRELNVMLERRVAEALAERKVLADLVEGTDAFVQVAGPDFRWLAINRAAADEFERIFGIRPKVGDSMLDLLADKPEHQAAVRAVWSRALAGEEFTEIGEFGDPGHERRHYEMKYHVLRGATGERLGAYQFVYDVTQRVREQERLAEAEAARREADALYRAYFENTPEALFVIGVEAAGGFAVEQTNPAHEAGVGFKLEQVRGKRIEEILPPDVAEGVLATYRHVVETGTIHQYREVFDLTGGPRHWDTSIVPVRDADGRIVRLIGSSRDVTRQVMAEEALRQSQKMEAMGQLTGGVAHDFNNLLAPIVGSLDMLQRKGLGGEREQRLIAGAMQSAERAKTLVQRLLAFARRQPLQSVPVNLAKLVAGMGDLVSSTTGPQIKVVVEASDDLPAARADPNQLEMAVLNLAVNARDAMPDGGTLRISATAEKVSPDHRSKLRPGAYVRLSVSDTGAGMDEATLARAVEPFFSTKGVGKGTGLGLSMVHGLASQLGSALTIQSRRGVGTNVELWLPVSSAPADTTQEPQNPTSAPSAKGVALLVDDEELVRMSTADMLADLGYQLFEAGSAEEALRLVREGLHPDVLITDHLMPGMTGTDLARALKSERPGTRILVVSGYAETDGVAPEFARLTKPFRSDEFATSLSSLRK